MLADWARLGQILDNLLANADRFAPGDTPITVKMSRGEPGLVTIRVIDRGPGVAIGVRERLFERFMHGDSEAGHGQSAGTGLGLAIVNGLVVAHAGSVALEESADGVGAIFRLTLPLAPVEAP